MNGAVFMSVTKTIEALLWILLCSSFSSIVYGAENVIPNEAIPQVSVEGLDLNQPPSESDLIAAGQLGGPLYPSDYSNTSATALTTNKVDGEANLSFGKAIDAWNRHDYKNAVTLFESHINNHPDDPWVAESKIHLACEAGYQGRRNAASDIYDTVLATTSNSTSLGKTKMANKARLRLGDLAVQNGNFATAHQHYKNLLDNSVDWRERTYASHWLLRTSKYEASQAELLNCGYLALSEALGRKGNNEAAIKIREMHSKGLQGQSVAELKSLAQESGLELTGLSLKASELEQVSLPAIILIEGEENSQGHYWLLEKQQGQSLEIYDPKSRRHFRQTLDEFSKEWGGVLLVFADQSSTLPGRVLTEQELEDLYGGCCGLPAPEEDLGDDGDDDDCGECIWKVNPVNMNFFMSDTPMWYQPAIGPSINISLSYNSQSALAYHEPFGNKWQFNYASYLVLDPGNTATIFMPDGRRAVFTGDANNNFTPPPGTYDKLTKLASNKWELKFLDDSAYIYDIPANTNSQQPFLTEIRDVHGQKLTFGYDQNARMTSITAATGEIFTLSYNQNNRVTKVSDPFGREAKFEYDTQGNLTKITDMAGYSSVFTYDQNAYVTSITNGGGQWLVHTEPADGIDNGMVIYSPPGDLMWENYRITITRPDGKKEEYYYDGYHRDGWYVSPENYVEYDESKNNYSSSVKKNKYDYTFYNGSRGKISYITTPEGRGNAYSYDSNGNITTTTNSQGKNYQYTFNPSGRITSVISPEGQTVQMLYGANGVDVTSINDGLGNIVFEYDTKHQVTAITNKKGVKTSFAYNQYGQLTSLVEAVGTPLARTTTYNYNNKRQLASVVVAGQTLSSYTYDTVGRIKTETDALSFLLTYEYDNLNRLVKTTHPDGKTETFTWSTKRPALLAQAKTRGNQVTHYQHNADKLLTGLIDAGSGLIRFQYDADERLQTLIDSNSNQTRFEYDADGLLTKQTYANGKGDVYSYGGLGRLTDKTNARGVQTSYSYDDDDNLLYIDYGDDTPDVNFIYDEYSRLTQRTDGLGTFQFTYDLDNNLTSINGPWANDTQTYTYDGLGRLSTLAVEGGNTTTYVYDSLGRLSQVKQGSRTYTLAYQGNSDLLQSISRPNGSVTRYENDTLQRLTAIKNLTSANQVINQFVYEYNAQDNRSKETATHPLAAPASALGLATYQSNNLNQLTASTNPQRGYVYDADGNLTQGYTKTGFAFTATYDAENRLKTLAYKDASQKTYTTEYFYQGSNLVGRIVKSVAGTVVSDTRFVRSGLLILQERNASNQVAREYLWQDFAVGGIGRVLSVKQGGNDYDYLFDGRGNVTTVINQAQTAVANYRYDDFGDLSAASGTLNQPLRLSTKYYDTDTGLSDFGYRFYDPRMGKWITRDPIGTDGGINIYAYVENNPINLVDPLGLWQISGKAGLGGAYGFSFGYNGNQFNFSSGFGFGYGTTFSFDPSDSGCSPVGSKNITFTGEGSIGPIDLKVSSELVNDSLSKPDIEVSAKLPKSPISVNQNGKVSIEIGGGGFLMMNTPTTTVKIK